MKTTSIIIALFTAINFATFATSENEVAIETKSRNMVEKSADWKTLADAAQLCFAQSTNLAEAALWLGQSLALNENAYNLQIKADFLTAHQQHEDAVKVYVQAMEAGLKQNSKFDLKALQSKISKAKQAAKTKVC